MRENGSGNILGNALGTITDGFRAGENFELVIGGHNKDTAFFLVKDEQDAGKTIKAQTVRMNLGSMTFRLSEILYCSSQEVQGCAGIEQLKVRTKDGASNIYRAHSKGVINHIELSSKCVSILIHKSLEFEQKQITVNGHALSGLKGAMLVCDARLGYPYLKLRTILLSDKRIALNPLLSSARIAHQQTF